MITLDEQLVDDARRGKAEAIHAVLAKLYPAVTRMALALAGREDVARGIVAFVMRHGARRFDKWTDADAPWRWFYHHTILTARRSGKHAPSAAQETLAGEAAADPAFVAFVRALRLLPEQQREAVLLWHGEKLPERAMAIAMDCSTSATKTHLQVATETLTVIAGASLDAMLARLHDACIRLTPPESAISPAVRPYVEKALRPRRTRRVFWTIVGFALAAVAIWAGFHFLLSR